MASPAYCPRPLTDFPSVARSSGDLLNGQSRRLTHLGIGIQGTPPQGRDRLSGRRSHTPEGTGRVGPNVGVIERQGSGEQRNEATPGGGKAAERDCLSVWA